MSSDLPKFAYKFTQVHRTGTGICPNGKRSQTWEGVNSSSSTFSTVLKGLPAPTNLRSKFLQGSRRVHVASNISVKIGKPSITAETSLSIYLDRWTRPAKRRNLDRRRTSGRGTRRNQRRHKRANSNQSWIEVDEWKREQRLRSRKKSRPSVIKKTIEDDNLFPNKIQRESYKKIICKYIFMKLAAMYICISVHDDLILIAAKYSYLKNSDIILFFH